MSRLKSIWSMMNLPCRDMSRLASESLDRDLTRLERIALRSHLVYCRGCLRYLRQLLFLRRALRQFAARFDATPPPAGGPRLPDEVRERIKKALDQG